MLSVKYLEKQATCHFLLSKYGSVLSHSMARVTFFYKDAKGSITEVFLPAAFLVLPAV